MNNEHMVLRWTVPRDFKGKADLLRRSRGGEGLPLARDEALRPDVPLQPVRGDRGG